MELHKATDPSKTCRLRIVWYRIEAIQQFGGGERVLLEGLRCFREMGAHTTLLLPEPISSEFGALFNDYLSETVVVPGFKPVEFSSLKWFGTVIQFFGRMKNFRETIRLLAPNLIIANEQKEARFLWLYSLGGLLRLPPIIIFMHGSPFQFPADATKYALVFRRNFLNIWASDPVYRDVIPIDPPAMTLMQRLKLEINCAALKAGVRMSRQLLVLSHKNRREVEQLYGVHNVEVICPGGYARKDLDLPIQRNTPALAIGVSRPILFTISRLIAKKRVDLIIRAFRVFLDREPRSTASLVIGGTGSEELALQDLVQTLGLSGRVHFLGFIPDSELGDWYGVCDLFLNADNADYDLTVMMALPEARKILVSSQYEIPKELASLRRFFFPASANPESFAEKIAQALATSLVPLGEADLHELRLMTWEIYFEGILDRSRRAISSLD